MNPIGLVLEGGGLRGTHTAGVLDVFLENGVEFPYILGVSAGACNSVSYITKQYKRNYRVNTVQVCKKQYMSKRNLFLRGSIFNMDMVFRKVPKQLEPFDYETFANSSCECMVTTTDCETGSPCYFQVKDMDEFLPLQASMSLPLVSKIVHYQGKKLLDGGIADPIPIRRAMEDGYEKNVVVLTQHRGYQKQKSTSLSMVKLFYRKYPKLVEAIEKRHEVYNDTLALLRRLEQEGKVFVIQPSSPVTISRLENDPQKLIALYEQGCEDTRTKMNGLLEFLA